MRALATGRLELAAELAGAQLGPDREPGRAQLGRDPQSLRGRGRIGADDDGERPSLNRRRDRARLLEREDHPVQPEREPDPGRRLAAQQFDQTVVAAAAAQRLLLAFGARAGRTRRPSACSSRDRARDPAPAGR